MSSLPSRFGINLPGHRVRQYIEMARYADRLGVDSIWVTETRLATDALVPLAAYAAATERIRVGSGIIPLWTRNPALIAQSFATLDMLAPGRVILGFGAWWDPLATRVGVERRRPVRAMREVIEAVRLLLARSGPVSYEGEYVHLDGAYLDHGDTGGHDVKVYIAAVGPAMLRLAGSMADGVVLNRYYTVAALRAAVQAIDVAARAAGRRLDEIDRVKMIDAEVTSDRRAAVERAKVRLALYLAQQPHIAGPTGVDPELAERLRASIAWPADPKRVQEGAKLVPDALVERVCCYGDGDEVRTRLQEYVAAGISCPIVGGPTIETIDALAEGF